MNKKFSTLMAGLMLASAFSVSAQAAINNAPTKADKYVNGKYYMLGTGSNVLAVESDAKAKDYAYGELKMVDLDQPGATATDDWTLAQTREALWQVTITTGQAGNAPKYSFVNVATGMTLSVSIPDENGDKIGEDGEDKVKLMISGGYMEWLNGGANSYRTGDDNEVVDALYSYVNNTDVIFLTYDSNKKDLVAVRNKYNEMASTSNLVKIQPYKAATVALTAEDLNKELITNNDNEKSFTLSFDQDVTEGAENLFTGVDLVATKLYYEATDGAEDGEGLVSDKESGKNYIESAYVRVHVKDTKNYLVVDTALHTGSEASTQLPKFTYADPSVKGMPIEGNNISRHDKAFNFKFAYEPLNDRVLIKVQEYPKMIVDAKGNPVLTRVEGEDGNFAYTYWPTKDYEKRNSAGEWTKDESNNKYKPSETNFVDDAYVRLVTLSSVRELTVAAANADGEDAAEWSDPDDLQNGMLTTVKIGEGLMVYQPTTIDSGLYLIQFVKNSTNPTAAPGNYYVANLGGAFGYAEQAKNQAYDHMPAAQWYVVRDGQNSASEFTLINREFYDKYKNDGDVADLFGKDVPYRAFATDESGVVFFRSGAFMNDTVKFIPVSDASKKDPKLGYKYVDEETSTVETYVFNYLHGLAASSEVGLNTPVAKDSLVRVDETGETIAFRLVPVIVDDSYGYQFDEKKQGISNLIRNAYYIKAYDEIKFAEDNRDRYLTYDTKSKKYVMSTTPTAFFLKENNDVDGVHYYALVEANYFTAKTNELVAAFSSKKFYPEEFKGLKAESEGAVANYEKNENYAKAEITFYDKNGKFITTDASENVPLYAYQADEKDNNIIKLMFVTSTNANKTLYYYMNADADKKFVKKLASAADDDSEEKQATYSAVNYADARVSVDDNTLDLTIASIEDKWNDEIRVSAFAVVENDAPLYRRFNGVAPETYGDASNAPLNLKFYRYNNNAEYLFENYSSENEYRDGITDNSISFLGVNNAFQYPESETRSYTMFVDTAYVRNNTRMPQYLIGVKPEVVEGDTLLCDASTHQHKTPEEALACEHTIVRPSFVRAMYLFNAQDSIDAKNYDYQGKAAYGADKYTRLAFKDAVHAMDTLYILNPGVTTEQLIEANFKNDDLFANKIALNNNMHKNVVFQFRLLDEQDNRFLIESEAEKDGKAVLNKNLDHVCVAPNVGGWVKVQNGVPVIARDLTFNEASSQADVFDVNDEIKYDATANDEIAVEGVTVVAGNGQVTIMGAAGKNVTITNILGKVIANQTIASDNATIAVPAGIVAVAVEGEAAVKAIVK